MRTILHYLAAMALLTIYGGEVCPFIETLTLIRWATIIIAAFVPMLLLRAFLLSRYVLTASLYSQPARQFCLEFGLFIVCGLLLSTFNAVYLHFPVIESGLKVTMGFVTFGFFLGLDLALERERTCGRQLMAQDHAPREVTRYTTLTRKFSGFALATVFLVGVVLILAVIKDVYWLADVEYFEDGAMAEMLMVMEISFILIILSGYVLTIINSYTRNIRLFFGNETRVLRQVAAGDLGNRVPTLTRDEFGEIAAHTNTMIEGLRERERIRKVFGKAVSPTIANRLIEQEEKGLSLGGSMQRLVIMFSDIRSFTTRTESSPPEMVINDLNLWFTEAVDATQAHGGIVDKFIGDGILAVFGLDGDSAACENAVRCAMEMQARLADLGPQLCAPMAVGIGIHKGEVLAGIVGSPERLEFTVIGDVVNTASRIEGVTRELDASILVSEAVRSDLSGNVDLTRWKEYGDQQLKGKSQRMRLFGLPLR